MRMPRPEAVCNFEQLLPYSMHMSPIGKGVSPSKWGLNNYQQTAQPGKRLSFGRLASHWADNVLAPGLGHSANLAICR